MNRHLFAILTALVLTAAAVLPASAQQAPADTTLEQTSPGGDLTASSVATPLSLPYTANFSSLSHQLSYTSPVLPAGWKQFNGYQNDYMSNIMELTNKGWFSTTDNFPTARNSLVSCLNQMAGSGSIPSGDNLKLPFFYFGQNALVVLANPNNCYYKGVGTVTNRDYPLVFALPEFDEDPSYAQLTFDMCYADFDPRQRTPGNSTDGNGAYLQRSGNVKIGYLTDENDVNSFVEIPGMPEKGVEPDPKIYSGNLPYSTVYFKNWINATNANQGQVSPLNTATLQTCNINLGFIPQGARIAIKIESYHPMWSDRVEQKGLFSTYVLNFHFHAIAIKNIHIEKISSDDGLYGLTTKCDGEPWNSATVSDKRHQIPTLVHADPQKVVDVTRDITLSTVAAPTAQPTDYVTVAHEYPLTGSGSFTYNGANYTVDDSKLANLPAEMFRGMQLTGGLVVKLPQNGKYHTIGEPSKTNATFSDIDRVVLLAPGNPGSVSFATGTTTPATSYAGFQPSGGQLTIGYLGRTGSLTQTSAGGITPTSRFASYPYSVEFDNGVNPEEFDILRPFEPTYHLHIRPHGAGSEAQADAATPSQYNNDGTVHIVTGTTYSCHDGVHEDQTREPSGEFDGTLDGEGDAHVLTASVYAKIPNGHSSSIQSITGSEIFKVDSLLIDCEGYNNRATTSWQIAQAENNAVTTRTDIRIRHKINNLRYFWIANPFDVNLSDIVAKDADGHVVSRFNGRASDITDFSHDQYVIYEYVEQNRNQDNVTTGYRPITGTVMKANVGYNVTVVESDEHYNNGNPVQVDVTLTMPSGPGQKTIGTPAYTGYHVDGLTRNHTNEIWTGWNLVGNPFLHAVPASYFGRYVNMEDYTEPEKINQLRSDLTNVMVPPFIAVSVQAPSDDYDLHYNAPASQAMRAPEPRPEHFTLSLTAADGRTDQTTVIVNAAADTAYREGEDMYKILNRGLNLYTLIGTLQAAYNELPLDTATAVPLGLRTAAAGTYEISLNAAMTDFDGNIILHDLEQGTYTNLSAATARVELGQGRTDARFEIITSRIPASVEQATEPDELHAYVIDGRLYIDETLAGAHVTIADATGRILSTFTAEGPVEQSLPARGIYMITIRTDRQTNTIKAIY